MKQRYNFLLINPWIYDFAAVNMWARPMGLLKVAEFLSSYNVTLYFIDCLDSFRIKRFNMGKYPKEPLPAPPILKGIKRRYGRYGISEHEFLKKIKEIPSPYVVLVTGIMTYWYPGVKRVIQLCKEVHPDVPLILGGIYPTLMSTHAEVETGADFIYTGRVDTKLLAMLESIGIKLEKATEKRPYYRLGFYKRMGYAPLLTSEGCPFRCSYCASGILWREFRQRPVEEVLREIEELVEIGVRDFAFYDDALLYRREEHIKPLLKGLRKILQRLPSHRRPRFHTPNGLHARYLDSEIAHLMRETGFKTIRMGLETVNPERQRIIGGKVYNEELRQSVAYLKEAGFKKEEIGVYLMYGLPGQHLEEVWEGVKFIMRLGVRVYLAEYSPIPGTEDWRMLVDKGVIKEDIDPLLTNNTVFSLLFSGYSEEDIKRLKDFVLEYNRAD
jgi:radical SAM superfamily enzyme YgiQ (UPF0313 family)